MKHRPSYLLVTAIVQTACASAPPPRAAVAPAPQHAPPTPAPSVSPTATVAPTHASAVAVRAEPPPDAGFVIEGRSDLPPGDPSTITPFSVRLEAVAGSVRGALAECLRPLGAPAHRTLRLMVDEEGRFSMRPPQDFAMTPRVGACVDGALRAVEVAPPPPRMLPYNLVVEVSAD